MNKAYRSVWNESTGTWVAAQENAASRRKGGSSKKSVRLLGTAVIIGGGALASGFAYANSTGYVKDGNGNSIVAINYSNTNCTTAPSATNTLTTSGSAIAFGCMAVAKGIDALAFGQSTAASADHALALGDNNTASGVGSIALGTSTTVLVSRISTRTRRWLIRRRWVQSRLQLVVVRLLITRTRLRSAVTPM
ncbi:ESPR-type extended signal peptide-containing protein [Paraburkholderia hospita]|uniref:ESPR-type extended signal peptide-containing protein n=1 Tax=Paraburkholderia hospita TaxID=169430 RepID=UPI000B6D7D12|nr:ESPR-type extended signal peptide-containing protein [Paraburkholderia hospita]OUL74674.1 hypothetical protein CA603_41040 [Paraburkholderia hospita]